MGEPSRVAARWASGALLFTTFSLASCDCRRNKPEQQAPVVDAAAGADANAEPAETPSPFVVVARGAFTLRRARGGAAYAVAGRFVFTLDPKGTLAPIRSLITEPLNTFGGIGAAPEGVTYFEGVIMGDATDAPVTLGVAGSAVYHVANGERFVGFFPWTDGALLTLRSEAASNDLVLPVVSHKSRFEALGGPKSKRVPKVSTAFLHADQFAAYPDGRVLLVASDRPKDDPMRPDAAFVLDFGPTGVDAPKRISLPEADLWKTYVSAGRSLADLVIYERGPPPTKKRLMILDGDSFIEVPLAIDLPIESLSRGDDGSLWLTTGYYGDGFTRGGLYRATITGRHADVVKIPLPVEPQEVLAISEKDVWLTASRGGHASEHELMHTQAAVGPAGVYALDYDLLEREAWSDVTPPPYNPSCQFPTLILGPADDLEEARVLKSIEALGDFHADKLLHGRLGGERVWAIESWSTEETKFKTNAGLLSAMKKLLASAHLVCAKVLVDRAVEFH